ncbi:MAG TPA: transglutaminase-like domain-containing protein, partial [Chthonomonadaceae bacterium]|nr:transglutaminase-like domain-containing protein [Chthonomonadaceae bacterium]
AAAARPLWISALVLFAASCTPDDTFIDVIAPGYFLTLLIAIRLRPGAAPEVSRTPARHGVPWRHAAALAIALVGGAGLSALLTAQRANLTQWGMQLLGERNFNERGSLSFSPSLSSTFGDRGSMVRALRIEGDGDLSHLRGGAFLDYSNGQWGPQLRPGITEDPVTGELEPQRPGPTVRVTRLLNNRAVVFAPINCAGLQFDEGTQEYRVRLRGDQILLSQRAPSQYTITLGPMEDFQGPLCLPLKTTERQRLLTVPPEIDPRVRALAARITRGVGDPRKRLRAVERYLLANNKYSLSVDIGKGDPVSNFLLQHMAAHCEYFASADVILLRLAGVPARYVVGYLGHEEDGPHVTVVRQRDAHAWAEVWIDGVGWVVSDATPGDGRPDALRDRPSPLTRLFERIQDSIDALRMRGSRAAILLGVAVIAALIGCVALVRLLIQLRRERGGARHAFAYSESDAELAALLAKFERACHGADLACPSRQTWSEYLAAVLSESPPHRAGASAIADAAAFVALYNRVRFGAVRAASDLAVLRRLVERIGRR